MSNSMADMDPTKIPALHPPAGVTSDLDSPSPLQATYVSTILFCLCLCTVALVVQLLTKRFLMKGFKWEDCRSLFSTNRCHLTVVDE